MTRAAYLAWGEKLMLPMDEARLKSVVTGLTDFRSVRDLADVYDSGVQLGADKLSAVRQQALWPDVRLETRLRKETSRIVEELLAGWRELAGR